MGLFYFILLVVICGAAGFGTNLFCKKYMKFIPGEERGLHSGLTYGAFIGGAAILFTTIFWRVATIAALKENESISNFATNFTWFVIVVVILGVAGFFGYIMFMVKKGKEMYDKDPSSLDSTTNVDND